MRFGIFIRDFASQVSGPLNIQCDCEPGSKFCIFGGHYSTKKRHNMKDPCESSSPSSVNSDNTRHEYFLSSKPK